MKLFFHLRLCGWLQVRQQVFCFTDAIDSCPDITCGIECRVGKGSTETSRGNPYKRGCPGAIYFWIERLATKAKEKSRRFLIIGNGGFCMGFRFSSQADGHDPKMASLRLLRPDIKLYIRKSGKVRFQRQCPDALESVPLLPVLRPWLRSGHPDGRPQKGR